MKKTVTSLFLVPLTGVSKPVLTQQNYINGYSEFNGEHLDYEPHVVYLLFRPKSPVSLQAFIDREYRHQTGLIDDFNLQDGYVVLVYKLKEEFNEDCELVKLGKYSKTSEKYQKCFPDTMIINEGKPNQKRKRTIQRMVFDKDFALLSYWQDKIETNVIYDKNMEVWNTFEIERETLDIDEVINIIKQEENETKD